MKRLHFIGIGGAGMAPLAKLALEAGFQVRGSDSAFSPKAEALRPLGAVIFTGHRPEQLSPDTDLVVYSSAVGPENCERRRAAELGIPQIRRGEFLGQFASRYKKVAAVSGSHGKSSTTAMLVTILEKCGRNPGALIGADRCEGSSALTGDGDLFVTEVDESDGTHTCIRPFLGIVPNIDGDHEWSVGGPAALEANFRTFGRNSELLLIAGTPELREFYHGHPRLYEAEQPDVFAGFSGFMARNAALAVRAAELLGVSREAATAAVARYAGIERRMGILNEENGVCFIEDYAHHPTEVRASIALVRRLHPGKRLHVVFQPHRYARLERFFDDFVRVLSEADELTILPVFAAWSETGKADSGTLCARIPGSRLGEPPWEKLAADLENNAPGTVVLLLGAGDISELAALLKSKRRRTLS